MASGVSEKSVRSGRFEPGSLEARARNMTAEIVTVGRAAEWLEADNDTRWRFFHAVEAAVTRCLAAEPPLPVVASLVCAEAEQEIRQRQEPQCQLAEGVE